MSKELEKFVRNHREEFDTEQPGWDVWEKVRQQIEPPAKKRTVLFNLTRATLSTAAALLLLVAGLIWWLGAHHRHIDHTDIARQSPSSAAPSTNGANAATPSDSEQHPLYPIQPARDSAALAQQASAQPGHNTDTPYASGDDASLMNEEMYHYARLVELKQKELKHIQKDEPLLYQQFSIDLHSLDSVYHSLQHQLNNTSNREQLLEAMVQDLQLQMKLLNHQLEVVKQINHFKKSSYDSAYKTL